MKCERCGKAGLDIVGEVMTQPLNTRQQKFIAAKLKGRSNARAAREAGYAESVAHVAGQKILKHPAVAAKLKQLMARRGLALELTAIETQLVQLDPYRRRIVQGLIHNLAEGGLAVRTAINMVLEGVDPHG